MPSDTETTSKAPRKRRGWLRLLLWTGGIILLLILLILIAVQIILMSDLPRRVLVNAASKSLGLRIEAKSFRAGWWGHSRLTGLTAALPLADHPFLRVPQVDVDNTSLLMIALTRSVSINEVIVRNPQIDVVQRPTGQWNLQQVINLFSAKSKVPKPAEKRSSGPPELPRLIFHGATIHVVDQRGRETIIAPLNVDAAPQGSLAYALHVDSPQRLRLDGTVALNLTFHQQFTLRLQSVDDWFRPLLKGWPDSTSLVAGWDGSISPSGELQGQLRLQPLRMGKRTFSGMAQVRVDQGKLILRPDSLLLMTGLPTPMDRIDLRSGEMIVDGGELKIEQLVASLAEGSMQIDGHAALSGQQASMDVKWQDLHFPGEVRSTGDLSANLQTPWPGQPDISLRFASSGTSPQGPWKASIEARGRGMSYSALDWTIRSREFKIDRPEKKPFEITDFLARLNIRDGKLALTHLSLRAPAGLRGRGAYDPSAGTWWLWVDSAGWPIRGGETFDFSINAWGNPQYITLQQLYAHSGQAELTGSGYYGYKWPKPLDLNLYASHPPTDWGDRLQNGPIQGQFKGYLNADGTISPLAIDVAGQLHARHLVIYDHALDNIDAMLKGQLRPNQSSGHIDMILADGTWKFDASYPEYIPVAQGFDRGDPFTRVTITTDGVSLKRVGDMAKIAGLSGNAQGKWIIDLPGFSLTQAKMYGSLAATNVSAGGQRLASLAARTTLNHGLLQVQDILAKQADLPGTLKADAWIDLTHLTNVQSVFRADHWTFKMPSEKLRFTINASSDKGLTYYFKGSGIDGKIAAKVEAHVDDQPASAAEAEFSLHTGNDKQSIDLTRLDGDIFGGTITGHMRAQVADLRSASDFWKWSNFTGEIHGDHFQLNESGQLIASPALKEANGTLSLKVVARPATRPHPLEQQYLDLAMSTRGTDAAHYGDLQFKSAQFHVYLGNQRIVFASDPDLKSSICVADGTIYPWLRISRHAGAGYFTLLNGRFDQIDLNQVVHAFAPDAEPMPGRLAGDFHIQGSLADSKSMTGDAEVHITESDLVNFDPLALLYNLMSVGTKSNAPIGHGRFDANLEQSKLSITNGHYFNRGIDAIGSLTINDVWRIKTSPIEGGVVGTARPLKDIKLPLIADADKLMANLQSFLTAVGIRGTLQNPKSYQTTLSSFGGGLQKAILGDVQKAKK